MAAHRGFHQPWSILSVWDPKSCHIGVLVKVERERPLDWTPSWCSSTNNPARCCN